MEIAFCVFVMNIFGLWKKKKDSKFMFRFSTKSLLPISLFHLCLQQPELACAKAWNQELNLGLPNAWQGSNYLSPATF